MNRREFLRSIGLGVLLTGPATIYGMQHSPILKTVTDDMKAKLDQEGECYSSLHLQSGYNPEPVKTDSPAVRVCPRYTSHVDMTMKPGPDEELYVKFNDGDWKRVVTQY